jgi:hypothetical protein
MHGKRPTGMAEKPDDRWALPLNRRCHMMQHAWGAELEWWVAHLIDPFKLAVRYYREYERQIPVFGPESKKPKRTAKIASRPFQKGRKFRG